MLICLSKSSKAVSSKKLSEEIGVSARYLLQIAAKLKANGLIETHCGSIGGYMLAKHPSEISLLNVIEIMEITPNNYFAEKHSNFYALDVVCQYIYQKIEDILSYFTIENLALNNIEIVTSGATKGIYAPQVMKADYSSTCDEISHNSRNPII